MPPFPFLRAPAGREYPCVIGAAPQGFDPQFLLPTPVVVGQAGAGQGIPRQHIRREEGIRFGALDDPRRPGIGRHRNALRETLHLLRAVRARRAQGHRPVFGLDGCDERVAVGVPTISVSGVKRRVVFEIVAVNDQDQNLRLQAPRIEIVKWQLIDSSGSLDSPCRCRDVEAGQVPGGEFLKPDVEFVGDGNLEGRDDGIADHGDMAAFGGAAGVDGLPADETQTVGVGDGPEFVKVGVPHLCAGPKEHACAGDERVGRLLIYERPDQTQVHLRPARGDRQHGDRDQEVPRGDAERATAPSGGRGG